MRVLRLLLLSLLALIISCAQRGHPSGGEGDVTAPIFIESTPLTQSVGVGVSSTIKLKFSEWIDPKVISKAVTISPTLIGGYSVKVKGRDLFIEPNSSFQESTTYHILVNSDLTDYYNNHILEPIDITFSTGDALDSGEREELLPSPGQDEDIPRQS